MLISRFVLLLAFTLASTSLFAQSDITLHRSNLPRLYQQNYFYLNPAFAGSEDMREANFSLRQASLNQMNAPLSGILSFHGPSGENHLRSNLGMVVAFERGLPFRRGIFGLAHAKRFKIGEVAQLGIGARLNAKYLDINYEEWRQLDPAAPKMAGNDSELRPDVDAGLWLNAGKFFAGSSVINILEPTFNLKGNATRKDMREILATAGYKFTFGNNLFLTPSFLMRKPLMSGYKSEFDVNTTATLKILTLGLTYRGTHDKITPWTGMLGIQINNKFMLTVATDVPQSRYEGFYRNNVEGSLRIKF
ncbi:PorP/SprF family type IX secretion system membrane protein [Adhaeribacter aquaticus]|uniref:PorP/SprF family type IX secretion system membrane protein n=1 Tax=Adhaeribacter aquaticus TaxID=299567 RepID=UPI00047AB470|nr:PorP/SprF family type IX secretion system membrane protein [Adhaeribacter aquaticus]